jgi:hypothetical protein
MEAVAPTRKGTAPLKVYCLPDERSAIKANAAAVGQTPSTFLRNVGMGYEVRGILDHRRVDDLARINGDLGRLGGLLKMWLTNTERTSPSDRVQIAQVLGKIEVNQTALRAVIQAVLFSR